MTLSVRNKKQINFNLILAYPWWNGTKRNSCQFRIRFRTLIKLFKFYGCWACWRNLIEELGEILKYLKVLTFITRLPVKLQKKDWDCKFSWNVKCSSVKLKTPLMIYVLLAFYECRMTKILEKIYLILKTSRKKYFYIFMKTVEVQTRVKIWRNVKFHLSASD